MTAGVYAIRNRMTGRAYVGGTMNTKLRWRTHRFELKRGEHRNAELQEDWTTLGAAAFDFEILEEISGDRRYLREVEQRWIVSMGESAYNQRKALDDRALTMSLTEDDQRYIRIIMDFYGIAKPGGAIRTALRGVAAGINIRMARRDPADHAVQAALSRLERAAVVSSERAG